MLRITIAAILVSSTWTLSIAREQKCSANEKFVTCGSACEPSCDVPKHDVCTEQCVVGCQCQPGFLRDANNKCVKPNKCAKQTPTESPCNLIDCRSGYICRVDPTGEAKCVRPLTCATMLCIPGYKCVDGPTKSECVKATPDSGSSASCATMKCAEGDCQMVDTFCDESGNCRQTPTCVVYNACAATSCAFGQECRLLQVQCFAPPWSVLVHCYLPGKSYCSNPIAKCAIPQKPGRGETTSSPTSTGGCAVVRCRGKCIEDSTGKANCIEANPTTTVGPRRRPSCMTMKCAGGSKCIDDPIKGGSCVPANSVEMGCKVVRCTAETICVEDSTGKGICLGRGVPATSQPPKSAPSGQDCSTMICAENSVCQPKTVNCFVAPCPPQYECVPLNSDPANKTCPSNESYSVCHSACSEPKCPMEFKVGVACTMLCVPGCSCNLGFVRNAQGVCVDQSECPPVHPTPMVPPVMPPATCSANQTFSDCYSSCAEPSCRISASMVMCNQMCMKGCACKAGFVRHESGSCIQKKDCEAPSKPVSQCAGNETYSECSSKCSEPKCTTPKRPMACPMVCMAGCSCSDGYVRNDSGSCVQKQDCGAPPFAVLPPTAQPTSECPKNETHSDCFTSCAEPKCSQMTKKACPAVCGQGCTCLPGFVRNDSGVCVQWSDCGRPTWTPPSTEQCSGNETFSKCSNQCTEPKCPGLASKMLCTESCQAGCGCNAGFVRNVDGRCVNSVDCTVLPTVETCNSMNEEYVDCGGCDGFCGDDAPNVGLAYCSSECKPAGCQCRKGFVRNAQKMCVERSQCLKSSTGSISTNATTKPVKRNCAANEVFLSCYHACTEPKCDPSPQVMCPAMCTEGCACKVGFKRGADGKCYKASQCPALCKKNEEFGCKACDPDCDQPDKICKDCNPGCQCARGFVRIGGNCVPFDKCPSATLNNVTCMGAEEYTDCMPRCETTCHGVEACSNDVSSDECRAGCVCRSGYKRNSVGMCTHLRECFKTAGCGDNETWQKCLPQEANCGRITASKLNSSTSASTPSVHGVCFSGCACSTGFARNANNVCVPISEC